VSQHGVKLPIERILGAIHAISPPEFAVVDGAQAFCQVSPEENSSHADLYLAGTHKWLRAYYPMGLLFLPRLSSQKFIEATLEQMLEVGELDDPLLTFAHELEKGTLQAFSETVNLTPLFSTRAALAEVSEGSFDFPKARQNADSLVATASGTDWRAVLPADDLRSAILLLQSSQREARTASPEEMRRLFQAHGIALTAYNDGIIRLSMPTSPWSEGENDRVIAALKSRMGAARVGLQ
jgi:selenocysteine lyase/cysteine desulfurase